MVQSHPPATPRWVQRCVASVAAWAERRGYAHEVVGDELFDLAPAGIGRLPATDVARLRLLEDRLASGWERVAWLDADVLVFEGAAVELPDRFAACEERWVTPGRTLDLVCNAVLVAVPGDDRFREVVDATLRRVAAAAGELHERALGPDVLTAVHRRRPLPLVPGAVLVSPLVVQAVSAGDASALRGYGAVNLCSSIGGLPYEGAVDVLLSRAS